MVEGVTKLFSKTRWSIKNVLQVITASLMQDLEQGSCAQDMVQQRSCNKDDVEISKMENRFLQKNHEDLRTMLKKLKIANRTIDRGNNQLREQQKNNNGRKKMKNGRRRTKTTKKDEGKKYLCQMKVAQGGEGGGGGRLRTGGAGRKKKVV